MCNNRVNIYISYSKTGRDNFSLPVIGYCGIFNRETGRMLIIDYVYECARGFSVILFIKVWARIITLVCH